MKVRVELGWGMGLGMGLGMDRGWLPGLGMGMGMGQVGGPEEGPWLELDREEEVMWPLGKEEVKCHMDLE